MNVFNKDEAIEELNLVALQIGVVKSELTNQEKFDTILELSRQSKFQDTTNESYLEWLHYNVFENKLPYPSSGCLQVAIEDLDNISMIWGGDEMEESDFEELREIHKEIIR